MCTNFDNTLATTKYIRIIFEIENSNVQTASSEFYIPIEIYTLTPNTYIKINYNLIDDRMYVREGAITANTSTDPVWTLVSK